MLRTVFDLFQITESQLTKGALMRLRIAGFLGLFALPLGVLKMSHTGVMNLTQLETWVDYALLVSILAFIIVAATRAVNRFFIPDTYLDEGEIDRKRHVNGIVFGILMAAGMMLMLVVLGFVLSGANLSLNLQSGHQIIVFILGIFVPVCCLQGLVLSFIAKPLDGEGPPAKLQAQDYKYLVLTIALIVILTALGTTISK